MDALFPKKHGNKTIKNILSTMGEGLACQHLSESAFTQEPGDALTLPKAWKKNTDADQICLDSLNPDRHSVPNKRILVVGQESGFSDLLMTKALGLAQRNICGIVALSVIPLDRKFFSILSRNTKEEIIEFANNSATKFKEKVGMVGIPFTHLTRVGKDDVVSDELDNNLKSISFVLVESALQREAIRTSIAVYSVEAAC